jgi:mono/diheme cytochrome c family protein
MALRIHMIWLVLAWTAACSSETRASITTSQDFNNALAPISPPPGGTRSHPEPVNPLSGDVPAAREGRKAFVQFNCYGCHGFHAGGGMGVSLRDQDWIYGGSEAQIFGSIARGAANGMPSWGQRLTEQQIWTLVTYIRTLATDSEIDPPR